MKNRFLLTFLLLLIMQKTAFSQNKDIEICVDKFLRINYGANQIIPDQKYFEILDYISNLINEQKIPNDYHICWQVEYLKCEKENDSLIEYKRLDYLLNYIETKHNIKRYRFKSEFYETEFCNSTSTNFMIIKP